MALTSRFYTGFVDNEDWAAGTRYLGYRYAVHGATDFQCSPYGSVARGVLVAPGSASGGGIVDTNPPGTAVVALPSNAADRWHLVGIRRVWGATNASTLDYIAGTATKQVPSRPSTPGVEDFQPLALCFVPGGSADVTEVVDLRVHADNAGILIAADELVRSFLTQPGTQLRIGSVEWTRVLEPTPSWYSYDLEPTRIDGIDAFTGGPGSGWSRQEESWMIRDGKCRTFYGISVKAGSQIATNSTGGFENQLIGSIASSDLPPGDTVLPLMASTTGDAGGQYGAAVRLLGSSGNMYLVSGAPNINIRTVIVAGTWYVP